MTATATKSLRERATAAREAKEDAQERAEQQLLRHEVAVLGAMLRERLGVGADAEVTASVASDGRPRVTVDGLTFRLRAATYESDAFLLMVRGCNGDFCRNEVERAVHSVEDVGQALVDFQQCPECYQRSPAEDGRIPPIAPSPDEHIAEVKLAGGALAEATARVQELADGRAAEKSAAIIRLVGTENPETQKPHSASSAEKVVESDTQYLRYRVLEREAEVERIRAKAHYDAVLLKATLAIGLATIGGRDV